MAILAEVHPPFHATLEIVTVIAAMGIMAGDTGKFSPLALWTDVRLAAQRMAGAIGRAIDMYPLAYLLMTGKAQLVNRHFQLGNRAAAMGIMAQFTHPGIHWTMAHLERLERFYRFHMALAT